MSKTTQASKHQKNRKQYTTGEGVYTKQGTTTLTACFPLPTEFVVIAGVRPTDLGLGTPRTDVCGLIKGISGVEVPHAGKNARADVHFQIPHSRYGRNVVRLTRAGGIGPGDGDVASDRVDGELWRKKMAKVR